MKSVRNEKGQSSVEYLLIVAVLVGAIFMFGTQLREGFKNLVEAVFSSVQQQVTNKIKNPDSD